MRFCALLFQMALVTTFCLADFHSALASDAKSYYLIGNSLTNDTLPRLLDGDVQYHIDCGKNLPYIEANPEEPCVKHSTLWPQALADRQYTYFSMQPHYGSTLESDVITISNWLRMQPNSIVIIHSGWARQVSREDEYATAAVDPQEKMVHCPAYIDVLIAKLREEFPNREFRQTHCMTLLQYVAEDIAAGKAPMDDISEMYRDAIHMSNTGRYLMHNAMRTAMGQPVSSQGFEEKVPAEHIDYLNTVLKRLGPLNAKE
ncbi:hypothetical protein [Calycomorphotria hydatis]|uniref:SGNH/GDSL hydrolase family protein n=1 Tax=Calycomorphotria hydatis TaxID=2528027 RepID=A0A517T508_9PLAN|nr:hypothetical protein [Calycomorphotria hydatis]QDT63448.1 hypothetical protein V22_06690 [Calycomorphotria hydatis]